MGEYAAAVATPFLVCWSVYFGVGVGAYGACFSWASGQMPGYSVADFVVSQEEAVLQGPLPGLQLLEYVSVPFHESAEVSSRCLRCAYARWPAGCWRRSPAGKDSHVTLWLHPSVAYHKGVHVYLHQTVVQ